MNSLFRKLRWLTERSAKEAELRQELQFHLEEETEERQAGGFAEDEARRAARRWFSSMPSRWTPACGSHRSKPCGAGGAWWPRP